MRYLVKNYELFIAIFIIFFIQIEFIIILYGIRGYINYKPLNEEKYVVGFNVLNSFIAFFAVYFIIFLNSTLKYDVLLIDFIINSVCGPIYLILYSIYINGSLSRISTLMLLSEHISICFGFGFYLLCTGNDNGYYAVLFVLGTINGIIDIKICS